MKWLGCLFCMVCTAAGCADDSEVFYTVEYPVTKVLAAVSISGDIPTESGLPSIPELGAELFTSFDPVFAGGSYRLDYLRYNGGLLTIIPEAGVAPVVGTFVKEPGAMELQLNYGAESRSRKIEPYTGDDGKQYVLLIVDYTAEFQQRYPDGQYISGIAYEEYTSTPY